MGVVTLEKHVRILSKINLESTNDPERNTMRHLSEEYQNADSKGHLHPYVQSRIIHNSQNMESP